MSKKTPAKKNENPDEPDHFEMVTDYGKSDDEYFTDSNAEDSDGKRKPERIRMYCRYTKYDVVKEAGKNYNDFKLTKKWKSDWDIAWFDGPIGVKILKDMQFNQRINHYPGIYNLARKNMLGRHLKKMKTLLPTHYNFFPKTYMLPLEYKDFREDSINAKTNPVYILKPDNSCQGQGIFLTRNWESVSQKEQMVAQRYLQKPHLIDGLKYDLRLYVFINGINPLRIYLYKDGLARFATCKYQKPSERNQDNLFMHLTNYAINKDADNYIEASGPTSEAIASKRSYIHILKLIEEKHGVDKRKELEAGINDILIKSICMVQPHVHHLVRSSQPDDLENQLCFQILGFDIMIDNNLRPFLIEINQMPSFATDSWLDQKVKRGMLIDCMKTLGLSMKRKRKYAKERRARMTERLMIKPSHIGPKAKGEKGETERGSEFQKIEQQGAAEQCSIARAEEDRRNKAQQKKQAQEEKERERRVNMIRREIEEAKLCNNLQLIFPILSYQDQFKIEDLYEHHEKQLKQKIESSKKIAADIAKAEKKKSDFDLQREVYDKITKGRELADCLFELDVHTIGHKEEETEESKAEKLFKNHVYDLVFQDLESRRQVNLKEQDQILEEHKKERAIRRKQKLQEKRRKLDALKRKQQQAELEKQRRAQRMLNSEESDEEEEEQEVKRSDDDGYGEEEEEEEMDVDASSEEEPQFQIMGMRDLRVAYLKQRACNQFMTAASNLWDQFTSGKALERVKKMREQEELEEKMRKEEQKRRAEEKMRNQKRLRQQMKERGMKEEELYKLFKTEMEEEEAEKEAELQREKARKAPIRKTITDKDEKNSLQRKREIPTGSTKDDADFMESYGSGDDSNSESDLHSYSRRQHLNNQTALFQQTMEDMSSRNDQDEVSKQNGEERPQKTKNKLPMLAAQNLTRAINKETANLLQYTQVTGLPAGHSAYSIQSNTKKLKNVDYYKLMKEKYVQKRATLVDSQIKDSGMGQGLGALTILNGQRNSVSDQSPIKLTFDQIRTKGSSRLPRKVSIKSQLPEPNTAGKVEPDSAKIPEYHNESDFSDNSGDLRSSVYQTPLGAQEVKSHEITKSAALKGKIRKVSRQSIPSSAYELESIDRVNPPVKAQHLHRTPNVLRKGQIKIESGQSAGPIIPGFSMMSKTINASKQFESQDEGTPQNRLNASNSRNVGKDSFNEWQSKFDQPTSQLMTTLYQDYNGSKRRNKSRSICTQQPSKQTTWDNSHDMMKQIASSNPSREVAQRVAHGLKPPASEKQFKEKTIYININDIGKKGFGHRKLSSVAPTVRNDFNVDNRAAQPQSPQPAARMLAGPGQSPPPFSYGRAMGITGHAEGFQPNTHYNTSKGLYLPKINSNTSQQNQNQARTRLNELQQRIGYASSKQALYMSYSEDQQVDYQTYQNFQQNIKNGAQTAKIQREKIKYSQESQSNRTTMYPGANPATKAPTNMPHQQDHTPAIRGSRPSVPNL